MGGLAFFCSFAPTVTTLVMAMTGCSSAKLSPSVGPDASAPSEASTVDCPIVADTCPASCVEIGGPIFDQTNDCRTATTVVGCLPPGGGGGTSDIACVMRSDGVVFFSPSSTANGRDFVICPPEIAPKANAAPDCNTAAGAPDGTIACNVFYRPSILTSDPGESAQWVVAAAGETRTFAYPNMNLVGTATPAANSTTLVFTLAELDARYEFQLPLQPGVRGTSTGLVYFEDPSSAAEIQLGCARLAAAVAPNSPTPTTTGALCNVTERTTPGGPIEQTKQVQLTPTDEPGPGVALRGGTFNAYVLGDKEEGGGFSAGVSWDGGVRKETGISQLFTYQSSGEDKYTLNTLLTDSYLT